MALLKYHGPSQSRQVASTQHGSLEGTMNALRRTGIHLLVCAVGYLSDITPDSHHLEEAFSDDGGRTGEPNFVATLTREKP